MGCGCGATTPAPDATAVLMCLTCRHARAGGYATCTLNGWPLVTGGTGGVLYAAANPGSKCVQGTGCPIGRKPDERGRVRWMGMRWRGVPWPLRAIITEPGLARLAGLTRSARWEDIPACGCIDRIKAWCEKMYVGLGWAARDRWLASK